MSSAIIYTWLTEMVARNATDIYITVGLPPMLRISDQPVPIEGASILQEEDIQSILSEVLTPRQKTEFETNMEFNFAMDMGKEGRFRVNVMRQRQHTGLVIRRITSKIPNFEDLKLPKIMEKLSLEKRGMILVVGVTSSGKSTTLAAMVDHRNSTVGGHIVTIEDPVEFYHEHKKGIITQREVGTDTGSFHIALKNALRQKPDVILVGEIRDPEVMEQAIAAAETGHLCYATLHTANAPQAVDRIINFFPEERHQQVRIALAMNLRAIIAQRLVRTVDGKMVVTPEIMLNEALIKELILKGDTNKVKDIMAQNNPIGMVTFDQSLFTHYKNGVITEETAVAEADLPTDMKMKIQQHKMTGAKDKGQVSMSSIDTSGLSL